MLFRSWNTERGIQGLEGLSLAVGVAVAETLQRTCGLPVRLKWPNDILLNNAKLGGVLIEVDGDLSGPLSVVIGIGLNVKMPPNYFEAMDQLCTDITSNTDVQISRNTIAANLVAALTSALAEFQQNGLAPFLDSWVRLDAFAGREVTVTGLSMPIRGKARGIDRRGALLVESGLELIPILAGDVSLRAASDS